MTFLRPALAAAVLGTLAGPAAAQAEPWLRSGSYEVAYRLELPHLERWALTKTATICLPDAAAAPALPILSGNNPFEGCTTRNVRRDGDEVTYDIVCAGRDAARAHAAYRIVPDGFNGRIAMVMGAKNMTMTEVQTGRRLGRCDLVSATGD